MSRKVTLTTTATPAKKKVAAKSNESKETQHLIEIVVRSILMQQGYVTKKQMDTAIKSAVTKAVGEVKITQTSVESRLLSLESSIVTLRGNVDELYKQNEQTLKLVQGQAKEIEELGSSNEDLKKKTLSGLAKVQKKQREDAETLNLDNQRVRAELAKFNASALEEQSKQTKDISRLKETIDEMLLKRYGFLPGARPTSDGLNASFNAGVDAGMVLDNMEKRMQAIEEHVHEAMEWGPGPAFASVAHSGVGASRSFPPPPPMLGSPSRLSRSQVGSSSGFAGKQNGVGHSAGAVIRDLTSQIQIHESELVQIKESVMKLKKSMESSDDDPPVSKSLTEEVKTMRKRVKSIAEGTSDACKTMSSSVADLQEATLQVFSWADKVHYAFAVVSEKLGIKPTVCPKIHVHTIASFSRGPIGSSWDLGPSGGSGGGYVEGQSSSSPMRHGGLSHHSLQNHNSQHSHHHHPQPPRHHATSPSRGRGKGDDFRW